MTLPVIPPFHFSPDHLHPILVNFTAALVPASVFSDLAGRILGKSRLHAAAWWMLVYAAAISPLTALAGLWWKRSVGDALPPDLMLEHQVLGIALAIAVIVMAIWRYLLYKKDKVPGIGYLVVGICAVLLLMIQGNLGGAMMFGS